jgi:large subunit ribosomal protein L19
MSDMMNAVKAKPHENMPDLNPGDAVSVHFRIAEGDRERVQEFRGTVIRIRRGGNDANVTVRRTASHGIGVERTFPIHSPRIEKIEVQRRDIQPPPSSARRCSSFFALSAVGHRADWM